MAIEEIQAQKSLKRSKQSSVSWKKTAIPAFNPDQFSHELLNQALSTQEKEDFMMTLLQYTVSSTQSFGAMLYRIEHQKPIAGPQLLSKDLLASKPDIQSDFIQSIQENITTKDTTVITIDNYHCVLVPCPVQETNWVLINIFSKTQKFLPQKKTITQLLGSFLPLWSQSDKNKQLSTNTFFSLALVELVSEMQVIEKDEDSYSYLVSQLQSIVSCDHVAFLTYQQQSKTFKLKSISGLSEADKRNNLSHQLSQCVNETLSASEDFKLLENEELSPNQKTSAHSNVAALIDAKAVGSLLLKHEDIHVGGLVFLWRTTSPNKNIVTRFFNTLIDPLSSSLYSRSHLKKTSLFFRKNDFFDRYKKLILTSIGAFILLLLFLPINHKVTTQLVVEPVEQRVISATQSGVIEQIHVKPGDIVSSGQVLALLDAQEAQLELDALQAEYASALKKRSLEMVQSNATDTQIAELNVRQISLRIQLIRKRLAELELKSPIDGVIIRGSFEHKVGMPVQLGQVLFEIAPLDKMRAELSIPADDVNFVKEGMQAQVHIDALTDESWTTTLSNIQPRSEIRSGENVFLARSEIKNTIDNALKPGMQGEGVIFIQKKSLGWVLFHKALYKMKMWFSLLFSSPS